MKRCGKWLTLCVATVLLASVLLSCTRQKDAESPDAVTYDVSRIEDYVRLGAYTGLTVVPQTAEQTRSEAVWRAVVAEAEVLQYPQEQVEYYRTQEQARYRYLAKQNGLDYEEALELYGVSEAILEEQAMALVKEDLVYHALLAKTGLSLSKAEKTEHFDRYVEKYVSDYGYDRSYVKENMESLIYDSMLYDKTMEYLILNNSFLDGT